MQNRGTFRTGVHEYVQCYHLTYISVCKFGYAILNSILCQVFNYTKYYKSCDMGMCYITVIHLT
jgi:hypothetical protein